jgi:hypothetical protein
MVNFLLLSYTDIYSLWSTEATLIFSALLEIALYNATLRVGNLFFLCKRRPQQVTEHFRQWTGTKKILS